MKKLVGLLFVVSALLVAGCGGGSDSADQPKLQGKPEVVEAPGGSDAVNNRLAEAEKQRAANAAAAGGGNDGNMTEGGK